MEEFRKINTWLSRVFLMYFLPKTFLQVNEQETYLSKIIHHCVYFIPHDPIIPHNFHDPI